MAVAETCAGCVYLKPNTSGYVNTVLECRRMPPVGFWLPATSQVIGRYPPARYGCGEYLAAAPPEDLAIGTVADPALKTTL